MSILFGSVRVSLKCLVNSSELFLWTSIFSRDCSNSSLVADFVTFHIFLDFKHMPPIATKLLNQTELPPFKVNCSSMQLNLSSTASYRLSQKLDYPISVARNLAFTLATTHYVLTSDIELYPNPDLIKDFLELVRRNPPELKTPNPKIFVNVVFKTHEPMPKNKYELMLRVKENTAKDISKVQCPHCHRVPGYEKWKQDNQTGRMIWHMYKL